MYEQPAAQSWQVPAEQPGPAPGVAFAPHGERLVAYIVDGLIVGLLVMLGVLVFAIVALAGTDVTTSGGTSTLDVRPEAIFAAIPLMAVFVIAIGYFPFFWARRGQTPGMKLFRLYVVRDRDGGPIGAGQALLRLVGFWVSGAVFYLGFIWVFIDERRRGWHDLIAGTVVVKR